MAGPPAATAAVRVAVRRALRDVDGPVAAAVSGGADSLALAAGLAFERPGSYALVVDHGLQDGSAEVASRVAEQCRLLGLDAQVLTGPAATRSSGRRGRPDRQGSAKIFGGGPEAAARALRYSLLEEAAARLGISAVLLGHTLDDQAETVLLGLARGSGVRSLSGMAAARGVFRRPLLGLRREVTQQACAEAGLEPWQDPHNEDPSYARVRVRSRVLPVLEAELGDGVTEALGRTAQQLRELADALDALTPELPEQAPVEAVLALPPGLRAWALKRWAERLTGNAVTAAHVDAIRALVEDWTGQGPVDLPGRVRVRRTPSALLAAEPSTNLVQRLPTSGGTCTEIGEEGSGG